MLNQTYEDVNSKDGNGRTALLMYAVGAGYQGMVKRLIEKKAYVNFKDCDGRMALMMTAVVNWLLSKGAEFNTEDDDRNTALVFAGKHGGLDMVNQLRTNGVKLNSELAIEMINRNPRMMFYLITEEGMFVKEIGSVASSA